MSTTSQRHEPIRTNAATGERASKAELLRWFVGPEGQLWPDWTGRAKAVSRSVHTGRDAESVRAAARSGAFSRGLKRSVGKVDANVLVVRAGERGQEAWFQRLGLANRAGAVGVGQAASRDAMSRDGWTLVLAEDAGEAATSRFGANARRKQRPVVRAPGGAVGAALGREFVSVAVVADAPFAEDLAAWAADLGTYPNTVISLEAEGGERVDRGQGGSNVV